MTERAIAGIEELLVAHEAAPGEGVRLVRAESGRVGITIAQPSDGDEVVLHDDEPLLIVERNLASALDRAVLDVAEANGADGAPRFTLTASG